MWKNPQFLIFNVRARFFGASLYRNVTCVGPKLGTEYPQDPKQGYVWLKLYGLPPSIVYGCCPFSKDRDFMSFLEGSRTLLSNKVRYIHEQVMTTYFSMSYVGGVSTSVYSICQQISACSLPSTIGVRDYSNDYYLSYAHTTGATEQRSNV